MQGSADSHITCDTGTNEKGYPSGGLWHNYHCVYQRVHKPGDSVYSEQHCSECCIRFSKQVQPSGNEKDWNVLQVVQMCPGNTDYHYPTFLYWCSVAKIRSIKYIYFYKVKQNHNKHRIQGNETDKIAINLIYRK